MLHPKFIKLLIGTLTCALAAAGCGDDSNPTASNGSNDSMPPSAVINLTVVETDGESAFLTWSAPGDDVDSGRAASYELRYADVAESAFVWDSATRATSLPAPSAPGMIEQVTVHHLNPATSYRFAVKTADEAGNWSELSNIVEEYFVVVIPDSLLEERLRQLAHNPPLPLHLDDLSQIVTLRIETDSISDLRGLEHCTNMTSLTLIFNTVSRLEPIAGLQQLTHLGLSHTQVRDISPVSNLVNLTYLGVSFGLLEDISPVASLVNLTDLSYVYDSITDLSPLTQLTGLTALRVSGNDITDLSPLASLTGLRTLWIANNPISDLSSLTGLDSLSLLLASTCEISDLTPLSNLSNLSDIILSNNQIESVQPLVDNPGLGNGDMVDVQNNPLTFEAILFEVSALRERGVTVYY